MCIIIHHENLFVNILSVKFIGLIGLLEFVGFVGFIGLPNQMLA